MKNIIKIGLVVGSVAMLSMLGVALATTPMDLPTDYSHIAPLVTAGDKGGGIAAPKWKTEHVTEKGTFQFCGGNVPNHGKDLTSVPCSIGNPTANQQAATCIAENMDKPANVRDSGCQALCAQRGKQFKLEDGNSSFCAPLKEAHPHNNAKKGSPVCICQK